MFMSERQPRCASYLYASVCFPACEIPASGRATSASVVSGTAYAYEPEASPFFFHMSTTTIPRIWIHASSKCIGMNIDNAEVYIHCRQRLFESMKTQYEFDGCVKSTAMY